MKYPVIVKVCNKYDRRYEFEVLCSKLEKQVDTNAIQSDVAEIFK